MTDRLAAVRRSIAREESLRTSGVAPSSWDIDRIVSFICSAKQLLADDVVRQYLLARSDNAHFQNATKLIDLVMPLHEMGFEAEALGCLRNLVRIHDPQAWNPQGDYQLLADKIFRDVLGQERLLVARPRTWGLLSVEAFAALLAARWEGSRWEYGEGPEGPDRYRATWLFEERAEIGDVRWLAGSAVRKALALAARRSSGEEFQALTDGIVRIPYTIAANLVLQTTSDAIEEGGQRWLISQAIRLLTLEAVIGAESTLDARRMLRRALPIDHLPIADRRAIAQAIRRASTEDFRRINELSDLKGWNVLSAEEAREVETWRSADRLFPPHDSRKMHPSVMTEWSDPEDRIPAFTERWPYPDEHPALLGLQRRGSRQPQAEIPPFEQDLGPRLRSLRVILAHPEAVEAEWLGTFLGYCSHAIEDLTAWSRLLLGVDEKNRALRVDEATALYEAHAPWWRYVADAAISRLGEPLPQNHSTITTELLHWGLGDPIYEALGFLDHLLIIEPGEPFDSVRWVLEQTLSRAWGQWPAYTRATTLAILRPYHWSTIPNLPKLIDRTFSAESDPHVLDWCLQALLQSRIPISDRLGGLIERIAPLPSMGRLSHKIGVVLGDALIRARGDREVWPELEAVARLAGRSIGEVGRPGEFQASLASGMMWGASTRLAKADRLTDQHAHCWLPLARQALLIWLDDRDRKENDRLPSQPIISVLTMDWTSRQRDDLLLKLVDVLERVFLEAGLATFCQVHYQLTWLEGEGTSLSRRMPDEVMIRLCHASSKRVAEWATARTTTNDLGFAGTVYGRETADLIKVAHQNAQHRDSMRRELAQCIDRLHEAGRLELAIELRLFVSRD